jgi:hypothetical protein
MALSDGAKGLAHLGGAILGPRGHDCHKLTARLEEGERVQNMVNVAFVIEGRVHHDKVMGWRGRLCQEIAGRHRPVLLAGAQAFGEIGLIFNNEPL